MLNFRQSPAGAIADESTALFINYRSRREITCNAESGDNLDEIVLSIKDFRIRLADTEAGRNSASMLINKMYSWRGYAGSYQVANSPNRITLTASMKDVLVGTVTLSIDSPAGLLADEVFKDEVDQYRGKDRKLCELTKLAFDAETKSAFAFASLFHICFIYARRLHRCTDAFIEINPRHRRYYERMLGFQQQGQLRINTRVDAPAYLLRLDLDHMEEQIRKYGGTSDDQQVPKSLYPYFFSSREEEGITQRLSALN